MNDKYSFLKDSAVTVAPQLLGCIIERTVDGRTLRGRIVETEAYDQTDAASHSYKGRTPRTDIMFGPAGRLYVYFTYGMHYCCNVVVGQEGEGAAVLIRAIEPLDGQEVMSRHRGGKQRVEISNGPAKLCQALMIDKALNGHDLSQSPLILRHASLMKGEVIVQTTRIGISQAKDMPWRFYIKDNPYVSK